MSKPATESSELIGIIAAMVILTFTFGTVTAMLLPIVTAIFALLTTLAIIRMLGHVLTVPTVAPTLATMIGLGVGIDYALFIVTRHFRGLHDGLEMHESIARATATSGGAVFFAGGTVTIALVSLAVAGIPLVTTMGLMAAIAVVVAVLARADAAAGRCWRSSDRASTRCGSASSIRPTSTPRTGCGRSGPTEIAKQPVIAGLAALAILIPLTIPLFSLTPRSAGHGGAVDVDHRAPGLRPDLQELRAGRQRAAAHRGDRSGRRRSSGASDPPAGDAPEGRRRDLRRGRRSRPIQVDKAGHDRVLQRDLDARAGRERRPRPRQQPARRP